MTPSLVVLGNLIVDDVVFADGTTRMAQPGGAVLYTALGARLWGTNVGCVSVRGNDYPAGTLDRLRASGIDLAGVRALERPGVRAWLLYEGQLRHLVHRLGCPSHEEVSPDASQIPDAWRRAQAFHLAPMPFGVQRALVQSLERDSPPFVSVDPHRPVTEGTLDDWRSLLSLADAFFPGEDELLLEGARTTPEQILPQLVAGRLRFVVYKRGANGGILYDAHEQRFHTWTARADRIVDQTGAGDAFAAAFVAAHVAGLPVDAALERAIVSASIAIESWGPESLFATSCAGATARLRDWFARARTE